MHAARSKSVSRATARRKGLRHYFTGKPCKHGHVAFRYTGDNTCVECVRLRRVPKTSGRYVLGASVPVANLRNWGSKDLSPREQWERTVRAARRQRLIAFDGCTTVAKLLKHERRELEMRKRVQRIVEAKFEDIIEAVGV